MSQKPSKRELRENPPPEVRAEIDRRVRLLPLMRPGSPGEIDWRMLADRMAAALSAALTRLGGHAGATEADVEHADRGRVALEFYERAVAADADGGGNFFDVQRRDAGQAVMCRKPRKTRHKRIASQEFQR